MLPARASAVCPAGVRNSQTVRRKIAHAAPLPPAAAHRTFPQPATWPTASSLFYPHHPASSAAGCRRSESAPSAPPCPLPEPAERFVLADLTRYWNADWTLERAGFGGGMAGIRGITCLEGDILATYPRDEVRACLLRRTAKLGAASHLTFEAGTEPGRAWELTVYADNDVLFKDVIGSTSSERAWRTLDIDLAPYAGRETTLRLYHTRLRPQPHRRQRALARSPAKIIPPPRDCQFHCRLVKIWAQKRPSFQRANGGMVDLTGLEPVTFSMSTKRSNQLS